MPRPVVAIAFFRLESIDLDRFDVLPDAQAVKTYNCDRLGIICQTTTPATLAQEVRDAIEDVYTALEKMGTPAHTAESGNAWHCYSHKIKPHGHIDAA